MAPFRILILYTGIILHPLLDLLPAALAQESAQICADTYLLRLIITIPAGVTPEVRVASCSAGLDAIRLQKPTKVIGTWPRQKMAYSVSVLVNTLEHANDIITVTLTGGNAEFTNGSNAMALYSITHPEDDPGSCKARRFTCSANVRNISSLHHPLSCSACPQKSITPAAAVTLTPATRPTTITAREGVTTGFPFLSVDNQDTIIIASSVGALVFAFAVTITVLVCVQRRRDRSHSWVNPSHHGGSGVLELPSIGPQDAMMEVEAAAEQETTLAGIDTLVVLGNAQQPNTVIPVPQANLAHPVSQQNLATNAAPPRERTHLQSTYSSMDGYSRFTAVSRLSSNNGLRSQQNSEHPNFADHTEDMTALKQRRSLEEWAPLSRSVPCLHSPSSAYPCTVADLASPVRITAIQSNSGVPRTSSSMDLAACPPSNTTLDHAPSLLHRVHSSPELMTEKGKIAR